MEATFSPLNDPISARCALGVFCRAPRLGHVKTRLAASRGDEFALGLYRAMLRDTFELARQLAPEVETFAVFTPDDAFEGEGSLAEFWDGARLKQTGGALGARMLDAFAQLRARGFGRVALIGSDSPDLPLERPKRAFEMLNTSDLTVGESFDGGFYLLGAARYVPDSLFQSIVWSSDTVYSQLLMNIKGGALDVATLPAWRDVDDEADLLELQHRLRNLNTHAPHTRDWLEQNA